MIKKINIKENSNENRKKIYKNYIIYKKKIYRRK